MNRSGDSSASMRDVSDGPPAWLAWLLLSLIVLVSAVLVAPVLAADVTLSWIANTEADLAGYKIYQSTISGQYGAPVATVGKVTTQTLTLPTLTVDQTYFWTITAYDTSGNESGKSNEASKLIPGTPPAAPVLTASLVGDPATGPWNVVATSNITGAYSTDVYVNGVLHHTDLVDPRCVWRVTGQSVCGGGVALKPIGTYVIEFRAIQNGVEVARAALTVIVRDTTAPAPPTGLTVK